MKLTIRMNGSRDDVIIDGHTFDRSPMSRTERATLAQMVVATFRATRPAVKA